MGDMKEYSGPYRNELGLEDLARQPEDPGARAASWVKHRHAQAAATHHARYCP